MSSLAEQECKLTPKGEDYMGSQSTTRNGERCAYWDDPNIATYLKVDPWDSVPEMPDLMTWDVSNYCRWPKEVPKLKGESSNPTGLWCYVWHNEEYLTREECDVPACGEFENFHLCALTLPAVG